MSLRDRLLLAMAAVAVVLIGAAVVVTRTTERHLVAQVDAQLRSPGAAGRAFGPGGPQADGVGPGRFSSLYVGQVRGDQVVTLLEPSLLADPAVPTVTADEVVARAATGEPFTTGSDGPDRYRLLATDTARGVLVVGASLHDVDATVAKLVRLEVVATLIVLGVLALVVFWVLRLGVRPVKAMTATATAIAAGDLSIRVPDVAPGTEAGDLGVALNRMLGHIEAAFAERARSAERLRQFVGDASHELRTPVTTIRGYAELYRTGGLADPAELGAAMRRTEQEAVRMGNLVEDLLVLARLDQGRPLDLAPVDLAAIAADAVADARAQQPQRPIELAATAVTVDGDEDRLRQVVANLLGNALVHTPPDAPVTVTVAADDGTAVLTVRDEGPGMDESAASRAFERFFRADPSRSRHKGGTGLGLAIVAASVEAHGGRVALASSPGAGTTVTVQIPRAHSQL